MTQDFDTAELKIWFESIADGDPTAFRRVFDAFRSRLYAASLKITRSPGAAEDVVQEIFTSLWESREKLRDVDNPSAYIFTIAYHKAFRWLRQTAARSALVEALAQRSCPEENETEQRFTLKEMRQLVEETVAELPPQRQWAYRLSREAGMSHREIAAHLHISELTVRKHLQLALRHIRTRIAKLGPLLVLVCGSRFF